MSSEQDVSSGTILATPYSLLPTPYSLLPTPYSLLPTYNPGGASSGFPGSLWNDQSKITTFCPT